MMEQTNNCAAGDVVSFSDFKRAAGRIVSFAEWSRIFQDSPASACGYIVSQKLYGDLCRVAPKVFTGIDRLAGTPIAIDPDLADDACEVVLSAEAWRVRMRQIRAKTTSYEGGVTT